MPQFSKLTKSLAFIASVLAISLSLAYLVFAWTEPGSAPPSGNASAPLNVSTVRQDKPGELSAAAFYDYNDNAYFIDPSASLSAKLKGNIDVSGNRIINLPDTPSSGTDAVNKNYADALGGGGSSSWAPAGTYFLVGGVGNPAGANVYYCSKKVVDGITGSVTDTAINQNQRCDAGDSSKKCYNGTCVTVIGLTYSGATHVEPDCTGAGGVVYNTGGSGTLCRFVAASCPGGWTQADNWQKYSVAIWGGDACNNNKSYGPTTFSNSYAEKRYAGSSGNCGYSGCGCGCCSGIGGMWNVSTDKGVVVAGTGNPSENRTEIGCK